MQPFCKRLHPRLPCRGEHLGLQGGLGCLASTGGMLLLIHPPFLFGGHQQWGPQRLWGVVAGVCGAFFAAGAFISIRFIGRSEPALCEWLAFLRGGGLVAGRGTCLPRHDSSTNARPAFPAPPPHTCLMLLVNHHLIPTPPPVQAWPCGSTPPLSS